MPPGQIERLPFATTKPDGSGLGLYLARACAENHGGTIEVGRSWLGGAEVRLRLPAERDGS
jgi:signal transduction histidine kinase